VASPSNKVPCKQTSSNTIQMQHRPCRLGTTGCLPNNRAIFQAYPTPLSRNRPKSSTSELGWRHQQSLHPPAESPVSPVSGGLGPQRRRMP
jgi:hypothetical protein